MTEFICKTCGEVVKAIAVEAWHRCRGKMRKFEKAEPEGEGVS